MRQCSSCDFYVDNSVEACPYCFSKTNHIMYKHDKLIKTMVGVLILLVVIFIHFSTMAIYDIYDATNTPARVARYEGVIAFSLRNMHALLVIIWAVVKSYSLFVRKKVSVVYVAVDALICLVISGYYLNTYNKYLPKVNQFISDSIANDASTANIEELIAYFTNSYLLICILVISGFMLFSVLIEFIVAKVSYENELKSR